MGLTDLLEEMRARLQARAAARLGCAFEAEDVMQEAWLKLAAVENAGAIANPRGFVTTVVNNLVLTRFRTLRRRDTVDTALKTALGETREDRSPERMLIARDLVEAMRRELERLPEKTRAIFLMHRLHHRTQRDIAAHYAISEEAVFYHVRRATVRLASIRDGGAKPSSKT